PRFFGRWSGRRGGAGSTGGRRSPTGAAPVRTIAASIGSARRPSARSRKDSLDSPRRSGRRGDGVDRDGDRGRAGWRSGAASQLEGAAEGLRGGETKERLRDAGGSRQRGGDHRADPRGFPRRCLSRRTGGGVPRKEREEDLDRPSARRNIQLRFGLSLL